MTPKPLVDLLNKCDPRHRIMLFTMPLRNVRVIATDESLRTFRVERLVLTSKNIHDPRGTWATVSTHGGQAEMQSYMLAVEAAVQLQQQLRVSAQRKREARRLMVPG